MSVPDESLRSILASDVTMRSIEWREKPLWQSSAFQLLAGPKGAGKGTYLAGLAARVTETANVVFVATEDSTEVDLVPRLVAAGAVLDRVRIVQQHVKLPEDVDALRQLAVEFEHVGLLVVDPVANHIGDRNSNSDAEVRHAIAPLNALASHARRALDESRPGRASYSRAATCSRVALDVGQRAGRTPSSRARAGTSPRRSSKIAVRRQPARLSKMAYEECSRARA